ncbi:MAG: hypothetical protein JSV90_06865 [Methanobacteriota archaeon]|nr:MAG: hypothetical protein JSV90_06865 [Euryarchaeota archaeon]
MRGYKCKCGFATVADRMRCPRCGKHMKLTYWPNRGKVLAYVRLGVFPKGGEFPMDLLMIEVEDGPKLACWTDLPFSKGDDITFVQLEDNYICSPQCEIKKVEHKVELSQVDRGEVDE